MRYSVEDAKTGGLTLWEVRVDGTGARDLLPGWKGAENPCCGTWTPDGRYYVFEAEGNLWARREDVDVFRRHSNAPVQLTFGPVKFSGVMPSRDGRRLFAVGDENKGRLARYDTLLEAIRALSLRPLRRGRGRVARRPVGCLYRFSRGDAVA